MGACCELGKKKCVFFVNKTPVPVFLSLPGLVVVHLNEQSFIHVKITLNLK